MLDRDIVPGLEYPLLFGLPENKTEILGGKMRVVWPFAEPSGAAQAFSRWTDELERWRGRTRAGDGEPGHARRIGEFRIVLHRRRVEMEVPIGVGTLIALRGGFWRRELWEPSPLQPGPGYDSPYRHGDIRMNLWRAFDALEATAGGSHCWGDVMLTPDTTLTLDAYYFAPEAPMELIGGDFAAGAPHLVAQVVTPATREADHGPRLALLHRAGVRHVWLLDPVLKTLEAFVWQPRGYTGPETYRSGDSLCPSLCPDVSISIADLFRDQGWAGLEEREMGAERASDTESRLIAPDQPLGLEHLLLLGHPVRRYEIWRDSSPCVLAFASAVEARARLRYLLQDAGRWAGVSPPALLQLTGDSEAARVGPFQFTRRENRVYLDVAVDPGVYRRMLGALADREVWTDDLND